MFTFKIQILFSNNQSDIISIEAAVLDIDYDLIIGRPTIRQHRLLGKLEHHMCAQQPITVGKVAATQRLANLRVVEPASKFLDPLDVTDGITLRDEDAPWQREINNEPSLTGIPKKVYGSPEELSRTCALLDKYSDRFSTELQREPADVEPMHLKVDLEKWDSMRANRAPPRQQSMLKNAEIYRQQMAMKSQGVIEESKADK